jgi:hypothetical protein
MHYSQVEKMTSWAENHLRFFDKVKLKITFDNKIVNYSAIL